jgi:hypothetical protein
MDRQYVGIDFHRRRSVIVRLSASGERLGLHRVVNDPFELAKAIALCGESPEVVIERRMGGTGRSICCRNSARWCISRTRGR